MKYSGKWAQAFPSMRILSSQQLREGLNLFPRVRNLSNFVETAIIWSKCGSYILPQDFWRENRLWAQTNIWANPIKEMTNRILTNKISVGGKWVRDCPTKLYLKVLYFKNSKKKSYTEIIMIFNPIMMIGMSFYHD